MRGGVRGWGGGRKGCEGNGGVGLGRGVREMVEEEGRGMRERGGGGVGGCRVGGGKGLYN